MLGYGHQNNWINFKFTIFHRTMLVRKWEQTTWEVVTRDFNALQSSQNMCLKTYLKEVNLSIQGVLLDRWGADVLSDLRDLEHGRCVKD